MNLLFLGLMYHPMEVAEVAQNSKAGLQNQVNRFQWSLLHGLETHLGKMPPVENCLPVGSFPSTDAKLFLGEKHFPQGFHQLPTLNLPPFKQGLRTLAVKRAMVKVNKQHHEH